jgi:hypothetical protein
MPAAPSFVLGRPLLAPCTEACQVGAVRFTARAGLPLQGQLKGMWMSEHQSVMRVQENHRSGQRGDSWTAQLDGEPTALDGDTATSWTVESWTEAQELATAKGYRLEPPLPGLRREMVEAGISRDEFGESPSISLFSHPHGAPDI